MKWRTLRAWITLVLFLCSLGALCACSEVPAAAESEETALQETVREYNRLLVQGFAQMDMAVLEPVATQDQADREYVFMAAVGEGRMRIEGTLVSLEFGAVESSEETVTVETHEVWDYRRVNIDTGELMAEERGVEYDLRYSLIWVGDRWVVAGIDPVELEDEGRVSP